MCSVVEPNQRGHGNSAAEALSLETAGGRRPAQNGLPGTAAPRCASGARPLGTVGDSQPVQTDPLGTSAGYTPASPWALASGCVQTTGILPTGRDRALQRRGLLISVGHGRPQKRRVFPVLPYRHLQRFCILPALTHLADERTVHVHIVGRAHRPP